MAAPTSASSKAALLEKLPLFAGLSPGERMRISRLMEEVEIPAGKQLAVAGDAGREMFLIVDGRAVVTTRRGHVGRLGLVISSAR